MELLIFTLFFLSVNAFPYFNAFDLNDLKIVGGDNADIKDYPYQVGLMNVDELFCGGSLITRKHVVTASHCLRENPNADIYIRAGSSYINEGGKIVKVVKTIEHPYYDTETVDYDVAVLVLENELPLDNTIKTITLNDKEIVDGKLATATGWGLLKEFGPVPYQLQKVDLPTISIATCQEMFGNSITERMLCAGYPEGGKDACSGDSGGPLALNGVLIGITSWGDGCGRMNSPGVYTNVAAVKSFIEETVRSNP